MIKKVLTLLLVLLLALSVNAQDVKYNNYLQGMTASEVIYEISDDIINNNISIIQLDINSNRPLSVKFVSTNYANDNNISCDDDNCTLFGEYSYIDNVYTIYILPEIVNQYYEANNLSWTTDKIFNTLVHELSHHYQNSYDSFIIDISESLGMDITYTNGVYNLNNIPNYYNLNSTGVPIYLYETINFPSSLTGYELSDYMYEIQARIISVCYQEKGNYSYYWDMVKLMEYPVCNQYQFPEYLDNYIAKDLELLIESYLIDYIGVPNLEEVEFYKTLTDITFDIYNSYINTGKGYSFTTYSGLTMSFTSSSSFNMDVYSYYDIDDNVIFFNLDKITQWESKGKTDIEIYLLVENTLLHELGHYIDELGLIPTFRDSYLIQVENGTLSNYQYYVNLVTDEFIFNVTPSDIPDVLLSSINFVDLYLGTEYEESDWDEETLVRLHSICVNEKDFYLSYTEMYELSDYEICDNFNVNYLNSMNIIGKDIIEGYIYKAYPEILPSSIKSKFELTSLTNDSFTILSTLISFITSTIILIVPVTIIVLIIGAINFIMFISIKSLFWKIGKKK